MKQSFSSSLKRAALVAITLFGAASGVSRAADASTTRAISLEEAIQLALQHNWDIKIKKQEPAISTFRVNGSYAVYEPTLSLDAGHSFRTQPGGGFDPVTGIAKQGSDYESDNFGAGIGDGVSGYLPTGTRYGLNTTFSKSLGVGQRNYDTGWNLNLAQPLLKNFWIDGSRYQIDLSKKDLKASEWALRQQIIKTVTDVEIAYYNLIFTRENVTVQKTALELAEQLLRDNKQRVELGALAPLDEKQSQSEVASAKAELIQAETDLARRQNDLKTLITDDFRAWHPLFLDPVEKLVATPAVTDVNESWRRGLAARPDIQVSTIRLEQAKLGVRFRKNQMYPDLSVRGGYGQRGLDNFTYGGSLDTLDKNNNYSYGLSLNIPLGNRAARYNYKEQVANEETAAMNLKFLEQTILVEIDNAVKSIRTAFQKVDATHQARLFAEEALSAEQKKLENGKNTPYFVLQSQRDLTQRRFAELQALATYNIAQSQLAESEGTTLERHKLELKLK